MKQQTYKIKSKQTLLKAKAQRLRTIKLKALALFILSLVGCYIFPYALIESIYDLPKRLIELKTFSLNDIEIVGLNKLKYNEVLKISGLDQIKSTLEVDLTLTKEKLQSNSRIEEASIIRIFPSKIKIIIKERVPQAIWWNRKKFYLVDSSGYVIEKVSEDKLNMGYLLIVGENANKDYSAIQDMLFHNKLSNQVLSIAKIGNRRWDLYLKGDVLVKLPEANVEKSLEILTKIIKHRKSNLSVIDLRLIPDKIYLEYKLNDE